MLNRNETKEVTGYQACCLCPFGLKNRLNVYIVVSLKGNDYITVPAGMRDLVVQVKPGDMERITGGEWWMHAKNDGGE